MTLPRLRELAFVFLKLGLTAFGGPAAHVGLMEQEFVQRRGWLTRAEFLDLLGAANLIPGPTSTEMAIHVGRRRAGVPGLLVAGVCFLLPAMVLVMGFGWLYVAYGRAPAMSGVLYGVKPVIIAVVMQALWNLARTAVKSVRLGIIGFAAIVANLAGLSELLVLLSAAFASLAFAAWPQRKTMGAGLLIWAKLFLPSRASASGRALLATAGGATANLGAGLASVGLWPLFLYFLKLGAVLFGSGYVLLAFLHADLVERWHWLTDAQLFDAIAIGQITPGPVFTTATFIGYVLAGPQGAVLATVAIFLPAFALVAATAPWVPRLRASRLAGAFLDGVNVASLALMAIVTWRLTQSALLDWKTVAIAAFAAVSLLRYRVNSAWLVLAGALAGVLIR